MFFVQFSISPVSSFKSVRKKNRTDKKKTALMITQMPFLIFFLQTYFLKIYTAFKTLLPSKSCPIIFTTFSA